MEGISDPKIVFENAYAVIVGLNKYEDSEIPTLEYADADARAFCQFLVEKIGFNKNNIRLLTNEEATKRNIESSISKWLYQNVDVKSLVIIFFTGHGGLETDHTGIEKDGVAKYLLPYDAKLDELFSSAISNRRFDELLLTIKSDKMVIFLDSCYSGGISKAGRAISLREITEDPYEQIKGGSGRFVIAASKPDQRSYEDSSIGHGIFTYHLLKGLSGEADFDNDGYVYNMELFNYLSNEIPRSARELVGEIQNPVMKSSITKDFALSFNPERLKEIEFEEKKKELFTLYSNKKLSSREYDEAFRILTAGPETLSEKDKELHELAEELLRGEISVETYRGTQKFLAEKYGEIYEEPKIVKPPLKKDIEIISREKEEKREREEREKEVERLRQEADAHIREKRYQDAETALHEILKINPADLRAKRLLEEIGKKRRKPEKPPEKPPTKPPGVGEAPPPPKKPEGKKFPFGIAVILISAILVVAILLISLPVSPPPPPPTPTPYTPTPINNPPVPFIDSINPSPALQGQSVTFTGHGEDPDSGDYITEYKWESSIDGFLSDHETFSTSSLTSGSHEITLRVKDSHGRWSSEITRNLKVKIYLHEDFESGMPENWRIYTDPEQKELAFSDVIVEQGTSNHILRGHEHVSTGPDFGQEWEDYSLQVRIMLVKAGCHLVVRRGASEGNEWRYFIPIHSDNTQIRKTVNDEHYDLTQEDKYLGYNTWHTVKVICRGDQIKVYIDGELVTEYIDANSLKNGRIYLETLHNAEVYYDDILVEEVDSTPTPPPTPTYTPPPNNPPDPFIDSIDPSPALQGQSVTFECHGEDPDSGDYITEYRWESSIDGFLSDQKTFSTSSLTSGSHEITLRVKDSHGQWSSEITRNLKVKIYLHEDFESGMPENWSGGIRESSFYDVIVEPGTSNHVLRGLGFVGLVSNIGQEWEDYSLQVRIMLVKGEDGCHLVVRTWHESRENNWRYFIGIRSDGAYISKTVNSEHYDLTWEDKYLKYNTWYTVKVICRGDQIKVYVDGELVTEYSDADPLKNGGIKLETLDAEVYYDDILVEEVDSTPTPPPTPTHALPPNNPPDPFIDSINPSPALQGQSVTFTCHGEDSDSGDYITEYRWESSIDGFLSDQKTFSTSSLTSGLHEIILRVKDSQGQWSSEITRNLKVKYAPKVAFRAYNGQYVCAEGGGGGEVVANRDEISNWETFEMIDLGDNKVALKAHNGQYVCAEDGGGREVVANRDEISNWETFEMIDLGDNKVALKAHNGQYVCAEDGGGREVVANRDEISIWETFEMIQL